MHGPGSGRATMCSYVDLEQRIPANRPLRAMEALVAPMLRARPRFDALVPDRNMRVRYAPGRGVSATFWHCMARSSFDVWDRVPRAPRAAMAVREVPCGSAPSSDAGTGWHLKAVGGRRRG
jgi:hypothetical protein